MYFPIYSPPPSIIVPSKSPIFYGEHFKLAWLDTYPLVTTHRNMIPFLFVARRSHVWTRSCLSEIWRFQRVGTIDACREVNNNTWFQLNLQLFIRPTRVLSIFGAFLPVIDRESGRSMPFPIYFCETSRWWHLWRLQRPETSTEMDLSRAYELQGCFRRRHTTGWATGVSINEAVFLHCSQSSPRLEKKKKLIIPIERLSMVNKVCNSRKYQRQIIDRSLNHIIRQLVHELDMMRGPIRFIFIVPPY